MLLPWLVEMGAKTELVHKKSGEKNWQKPA